jgi:hypothetical protein
MEAEEGSEIVDVYLAVAQKPSKGEPCNGFWLGFEQSWVGIRSGADNLRVILNNDYEMASVAGGRTA